MNDINEVIKHKLYQLGADLVGFGDLAQVTNGSFPVGISIAVKFPKEIIRQIHDKPTKEYHQYYEYNNGKLEQIADSIVGELKTLGFKAMYQPATYDGTVVPHKTVATRAGLGWIGKCALLVTQQYGSMVRLISVLTNAPLRCAKPVNKSYCGDCMACVKACPGGAVKGINWTVTTKREDIFDHVSCRETARERSFKSFGVKITLCGKCIEVCPYTQKYLNSQSV